MTQRYQPTFDEPDESPADARLRELRNECFNEAPIKLNQLAERVRSATLSGYQIHNDLANELQQYGLRLRRMAEEAR